MTRFVLAMLHTDSVEEELLAAATSAAQVTTGGCETLFEGTVDMKCHGMRGHCPSSIEKLNDVIRLNKKAQCVDEV